MKRGLGAVGLAAAIGSGSVLLGMLAPPEALAGQLRLVLAGPEEAVDSRGADAVVLTLVAALAWAALGWLTAACLLVGAATLPGRAGAVAGAASCLVAPTVARRLLAGVLGATLLTGFGAGTATAAPPGAPPGPTSLSRLDLDWPASVDTAAPGPRTAGVAPRHSHPAHAGAASPEAGADVDDAGWVVVAHGDSLWEIAATRLGPAASDDEVAREWPRWWARNRAVVGADPGLIRPGQRLAPPG